MSAAADSPRPGGVTGGVYRTLPRLGSLASALTMSGLIFANPRAFAQAGHGWLALVMLGVCAGFVHGVGFMPYARAWRILFSPWLAWAIMGLGLWLVLHA